MDIPQELVEKIKQILDIDSRLVEKSTPIDIKELTLPPFVSLVKQYKHFEKISLAKPDQNIGALDIFGIINRRRSCRNFKRVGLKKAEISKILYYSLGITAIMEYGYGLKKFPLRATPSAGGLHGIDLYLLNRFEGEISPGFYYYDYINHQLVKLFDGDPTITIYKAFAGQIFVDTAPLWIVLVLNLIRGVWKYGVAYYKLGLLDAGVIMEQIHLLATALNLCSCMIGGFNSYALKKAFGLRDWELPLGAIAVGYKEG